MVVRCWGVGVGTGGTGVVFSVVLCLVESWHRLRNWCLVFTKGDTGVVDFLFFFIFFYVFLNFF